MPQSETDLHQLTWQLTLCDDLACLNYFELLQFILNIHGKLKVQEVQLPFTALLTLLYYPVLPVMKQIVSDRLRIDQYGQTDKHLNVSFP